MTFTQRFGWVGVDVGTHTVKLAQAARTPAGVRLHRAAVIPRSTAWPNLDKLAWDQPLPSEREIQAAFRAGDFVGRDAAGSLPMNVCQLRGLNIPPGTNHERRTMIADELAEEWSEQGSAMEFDFWELDTPAAERAADCFNVDVLAVTRPWIAQVARDCHQAGLACWAVDGLPLAMARAIGLAGGFRSGRCVMAIDWGYSNTTLCIVGENRPLYVRRIHHSGFGQVLNSVARDFGVTQDEAQHLVDAHGLALAEAEPGAEGNVQHAIVDAAAETLDVLAREVIRTLHFLENQRRHLQPTAIWLLGGGASMRNIGPYLKRQLQLPVKTWRTEVDDRQLPFAAGPRAAVFAGAMALSALAWRTAA